MGWAWARMQSQFDTLLTVNGVDVDVLSQMSSVPSLVKHVVTSPAYPSAAAGIGLNGNEEGFDISLFECGVLVAYQGPTQNPALFPFQLLLENSETPIVDDLRADLPDTYELLLQVTEGDAQVSVEVYAITSEEQEPQLRDMLYSSGGSVRVPIQNPGIEVACTIRVTDGNTHVGLRRRLNV